MHRLGHPSNDLEGLPSSQSEGRNSLTLNARLTGGGGIKFFRWLRREEGCRGEPVVLKVISARVVDTKEPGIQDPSTIEL